jgi:hypothetical protein
VYVLISVDIVSLIPFTAQIQGDTAANPTAEPGPSSTNPMSHREDLTDSILRWQFLPIDVRRQPPVYPSQVYGIHHLLRLFGKEL